MLPIISRHIEPGTIIRTDMWKAYENLEELGFQHKIVNHSDKQNPFVAEDGTHTNRIESSWRPAKDYFRTVHLRSVCNECETKLNVVGAEARAQTQVVNEEQEECEECEECGRHPCTKHKGQLKAVKHGARRRIRAIYDARAECEECQYYANRFADKLVEYLWRRQMQKENRNPFMEVVKAIVDSY